jgi:hypothetical protein
MLYLTLNATEKVRTDMVLFAGFIGCFNLQVLSQSEDIVKGTLELTITHCGYPITRSVQSGAQDIFGADVIKIW